MSRNALVAGLLLTIPLATPSLLNKASACAWDSDTLAAEAKGIPDVVRVITGRFERNPPLYYELRLKRVAAELVKQPGKLENYDDAGVACDRLGRADEAIAWMAKKKLQLNRLPAGDAKRREHLYRYYANLGTFWAHRWVSNGAKRSEIDEMKRGHALIAAAIKINPDAHFGREKYQLRAMDWIINPPKKPKNRDDQTMYEWERELPNLLRADDRLDNPGEAVKALSGIVVLGNAWENVDTFNALAKALIIHAERSSPSYMARLRACDLVDRGKKSLLPRAPTGAALKKLLKGESGLSHMLRDNDMAEVEEVYRSLRREADTWQAARTAYMLERLQAGRHPDTDPTFWNDYRDTPPPSLDERPSLETTERTLIIGLVIGLTTIWILRKRFHTRRVSM